MYCRLANGVLVDLSAGKYKNCSEITVSYTGAKQATVQLSNGSKVFSLPSSLGIEMLNTSKIGVSGYGIADGAMVASITKDGIVTMTKAATKSATSNLTFVGLSSSKCGGWKYFLADCPKGNMLCSGMSGAWVPATTVCGQSLF